MSRVDNPWALKRFMRLLRVLIGEGMAPELAAAKLAVLESRLPSFTLHPGPPSCLVRLRSVKGIYILINETRAHLYLRRRLIFLLTKDDELMYKIYISN